MNHAARLGIVLLAGLFVGAPALAADEPFLGRWVLNAAKSSAQLGAVPAKATVIISSVGRAGVYTSVSDTTIGGVTMHGEITFALDGKDYKAEITPAPPGRTGVTQSFEGAGTSAYKTTLKLNGQTVATTLNEVSADGKTLTLTTTGAGALTNSSSVTVYDRQ